MTIEQFFDENTYNLTPAEYNDALRDLQSMDMEAWVKRWGPTMMEKAVGWNQVDEVRRAKRLPERIAAAFGDVKFAPGKNFKNDVYEAQFSDVPRDQFDKALAKMKEYYDAEVKGREDEAMRKKREKEVKNWGFLRNAIASEYEKQRYVDKPETALFGEQAPRIGEAPEFRVGATADLLAGAAGAAGDALPGVGGILVGPAIRAGRDVGHKLTDSPYQKDWSQIASDFGSDAALNIGANYLTNFRTWQRVGRNAGKVNPSGVALELDIARNQVVNPQVDALYGPLLDEVTGGSKQLLNTDIIRLVNELPESPMKAELMGKIGTLNHIDRMDLVKTIGKWRDLSMNRNTPTISMLRDQVNNPTGSGMTSSQFGGIQLPSSNDAYGQYFTKIVTEPKLSNGQKAMHWLLSTVNKADTPIGAATVKEFKTGYGRGSEPTITETPEERAEIEAIKEREAPWWNRNGEQWFTPNKDNSLLYKAWEEYAAEHGWLDGGKK